MGKESVRSRLNQLKEWLQTTKRYKQKQTRRKLSTKNNHKIKW